MSTTTLFERMPANLRDRVRERLESSYGKLGPLSSWTIEEVANLLDAAAARIMESEGEFGELYSDKRRRAHAFVTLSQKLEYQAQRIKARKHPIERALAQHLEQQRKLRHET